MKFDALRRRLGLTRDRTINYLLIAGLAAVVVGGVVFAREFGGSPGGTVDDGPPATPMLAPRSPEPLRGPPPNVVLILTDDQRADDLRVMPNVKRLLIDQGVTFSNAFVSTPLCCPSRASILTGQHAFHTGVWGNAPPHGGVFAFKGESSIATWLHDAGYNTSYVGKYLNGYEQLVKRSFVAPGWDDWHGWIAGKHQYFNYSLNENGKVNQYGSAPGDYLTDVLSSRATEFIAGAKRPFFLHFAPFAPHAPAVPAPRDASAFADEPLFRPPSWQVRASKGTPAGALPVAPDWQVKFWDRYHKVSLASLQSVDRAVAAIFDAVAARGELDNTLFVFMSDNGFLLGEHRIFNKAWPYENAIRVPLVVRIPRSTESFSDAHLVMNVDIAPTITELAGVRPGLRPDGMSLVPLLRGEPIRWRQEVLIEYLGAQAQPDFPPRYLAIRTDHLKLIAYEDGSRELFDLSEDPWELENLAGTKAGAELEDSLYERLGRLTPRGRLPQKPATSATPRPAPVTSNDLGRD